jgi:hypothetical protein
VAGQACASAPRLILFAELTGILERLLAQMAAGCARYLAE